VIDGFGAVVPDPSSALGVDAQDVSSAARRAAKTNSPHRCPTARGAERSNSRRSPGNRKVEELRVESIMARVDLNAETSAAVVDQIGSATAPRRPAEKRPDGVKELFRHFNKRRTESLTLGSCLFRGVWTRDHVTHGIDRIVKRADGARPRVERCGPAAPDFGSGDIRLARSSRHHYRLPLGRRAEGRGIDWLVAPMRNDI